MTKGANPCEECAKRTRRRILYYKRKVDKLTKGPHSIGKEREEQFCRWLKNTGLAVDAWTPPMGKYRSNDIFGVFDVVYIGPGGLIYFAQLCHPNSKAARIRKIDRWMGGITLLYAFAQLWTYDKDLNFRMVDEW